MSKKIVVTARGLKLDMDLLKKSQPNTKPVIAAKKEKPHTSKASIKVVKIRKQRLLNAETPAPRPVSQVASESTVDQTPVEKEQARNRKKEDKNVSNNSN